MISKKELLEKMAEILKKYESNGDRVYEIQSFVKSLPDDQPDTREPRGEAHYPGSYYQPLFNHMSQNHNMPLLQDEMDEIIRVVKEMTDQPDLLPFQWPVPDGMEVVSRDGRKVEQLHEVKGANIPFVGLIFGSNMLAIWNTEGKWDGLDDIDDDRDLFLRRKEKKVWVVEWEAHNGVSGKNYFDTINEAQELCKRDDRYHSSATIYETTLKPVV